MSRANRPVDVFKYIDMPTDGNPDPCWEWTAGKSGKDERGYFSCKGVKWLAYRLVYSLVNGDLPPGMMVRHKCDNPSCCNPYHLIKGTQSENENDKYERDRYGFPVKLVERVMELVNAGVTSNVAISSIVTKEMGIKLGPKRVSDIRTGARRANQSGVK